MKLKTVLTAGAIVVAISGSALAQGSSGQGPNTGTNAAKPPKKTKSTAGASTDKHSSPASENSGEKQDK